MSTTKTIKIQKNKVLTYSINKSGFQTVNKTITVTGDTTITEELVSQTGSPIQQLGDRLLGISTYVCDFIPSGTYDVDSLKFITASQTTGTGLTNIQVVKSLWLAQIETTLSVETPKGTSNTFTFTYNSSTWDLTGAVTVSGISATDLGDVYGITFSGTAVNGDVITVVETQYNKFACYVLDSNYRNNKTWGSTSISMPKQYGSNPQNCIESATYFNNYIINNVTVSNYPSFKFCIDKGFFILPNNIKINCVLPNGFELQAIYNNRIVLDTFDPVIQAGGTNFNLSNWAFGNTGGSQNKKLALTCLEFSAQGCWALSNDNNWYNQNLPGFGDRYTKTYGYGTQGFGVIPVFEVPVM